MEKEKKNLKSIIGDSVLKDIRSQLHVFLDMAKLNSKKIGKSNLRARIYKVPGPVTGISGSIVSGKFLVFQVLGGSEKHWIYVGNQECESGPVEFQEIPVTESWFQVYKALGTYIILLQGIPQDTIAQTETTVQLVTKPGTIEYNLLG